MAAVAPHDKWMITQYSYIYNMIECNTHRHLPLLCVYTPDSISTNNNICFNNSTQFSYIYYI